MFKIGQKVVCKNAKSTIGLVQDKVYSVIEIFTCPKCGLVSLVVHDGNYCTGTRCDCGQYSTDGFNFYRPDRFEPLKYDLIDNMDIIKEMIPERSDVPIKEPKRVKKGEKVF
jgi:hypothetical protein